MSTPSHTTTIRVRYGETDRMNTIYNARVLEWYEVARTEHLRELGMSYADIEERGIYFPVIEAKVSFSGPATYDDRLQMESRMSRPSRLRVRFDIDISHKNDGAPVANGYSVHGVADADGRPARPPKWLNEILEKGTSG